MIERGLEEALRTAMLQQKLAEMGGDTEGVKSAITQQRLVKELLRRSVELQRLYGVSDIADSIPEATTPSLEEKMRSMSDKMRELHEQWRDKPVGDLLKFQRKQERKTLADVANLMPTSTRSSRRSSAAGISISFLSLVENNERLITVERAIDYLLALNLDIGNEGLPSYTLFRVEEQQRQRRL